MRLEIPLNVELTAKKVANLIALNRQGQINWSPVNQPAPLFEPLPLKIMNLDRSGKLLASDFLGRRLEIEQLTGRTQTIGASK